MQSHLQSCLPCLTWISSCMETTIPCSYVDCRRLSNLQQNTNATHKAGLLEIGDPDFKTIQNVGCSLLAAVSQALTNFPASHLPGGTASTFSCWRLIHGYKTYFSLMRGQTLPEAILCASLVKRWLNRCCVMGTA